MNVPRIWRMMASFVLAFAIGFSWLTLAKADEPAKGNTETKATTNSETGDASKPADNKASEIKPIVAVFRLTGELLESPQDESLPFGNDKTTSLKELVERLQKARDDKAVKAVVLTTEDFSPGWAQIEELRESIAQVRAAGKDVFAHVDYLPLGNYLLLSGASQISVVPTGDVWLTGLHGEAPYLRGLLNKLGVTPDFLTCGAYKSAAEMFMREGPSPQAEEMQNWLLDSLCGSLDKLIAKGRGVEIEKVHKWIDEGPYTARKAHDVGLIDAVQHRQEFEAGIKQRFDNKVTFDYKYGEKPEPKIDFSSPIGIFNFYAQLLGGPKIKSHKDSVAIVYVEGPIVLGSSETSLLEPGSKAAASTPIRRALNKAAADDTIKAVVLRIDSPGGSATASEIILNATQRVKAKKPLVVSMGDVAGSGGYYVACGADTVFADASTITGSIGVVGGKLATTEMWNKIGISWKEYNRGANASLMSSARIFTPEQHKLVQDWMDEIYGVFKQHVLDIRGKRLKKPLDDIAGGRVYTGTQALDLGLVDKVGTLEDAVKFAAQEAKLDKYDVRTVPEPKNFLEKLIDSQRGDDDENEVALPRNPLPAATQVGLLNAALPLLRDLDPPRVKAVLRALEQLETVQHEGIVLMAPEFLLNQSGK